MVASAWKPAEPVRDWEPLATGPLREECRDWIEEIAAALRREIPDSRASLSDASVGCGFSGIALFFLYRFLAWGEEDDRETALDYLSAAIEVGSRDPGSASLIAGLPGIGWAVEHARRILGDDGADPLEDVDEAVEIMANALARGRGETDLLYGLAGLGVYAADRLPRARARRALESVIRGLDAQAVPRENGVAWERNENDPEDESKSVRIINLGVAHGIPASIAVLADARRAGILPTESARLLEGATRFLLAQRRKEDDAPFRFPGVLRPDRAIGPSRPTWCYGDPGVACVLHWVGTQSGRPDWIQAARDAARTAARRRAGDSGIEGVTFCHGAAGTAHLFARLFGATGDSCAAEAAIYWCERLLERRRKGAGVGGVLSDPPPNGYENWQHDPSLLSGATGVGLVLISLATSVEPQWDRLFLASPTKRDVPS